MKRTLLFFLITTSYALSVFGKVEVIDVSEKPNTRDLLPSQASAPAKELKPFERSISPQSLLVTDLLNLELYGKNPQERNRWEPDLLVLAPEYVYGEIHKKFPHIMKQENLQDYIAQKGKAAAIFEQEFVPNDPEKRKEFFIKNKQFGILKPELVKQILQVAQRIMKKTQKGDYIVIFGNTPYFVGHALKKIISNNPNDPAYRTLIEFPFSGAPNSGRDYVKDIDIVTPERLSHLVGRLEKVGLTPKNKDLLKHAVYFVDVIGMGAGVAYVIEELIRQFKQASLDIPNFNVISLNKININDRSDNRNYLIAKENADDGQRLTFFFPNHKNPRFTVDAQVIYLPDHGVLDNLPVMSWRIFPTYNAAYWQKEFDYLLNQKLTPLQQLILEYLDFYLDQLMEKKSSRNEPFLIQK